MSLSVLLLYSEAWLLSTVGRDFWESQESWEADLRGR